MQYKKFIFDFDGTLVDSMPTYISVMLRVLDENNIKYEKDIVKIITPLGYVGTARYFRSIGVELPEEELLKTFNEYAYYEYANNIQAKSNVRETLLKLKEQEASLNVLTASPHLMLDTCLKRLDMYEIFDNVWSCDDFNTTKADPEIYVRAAERLNSVVEDVLFLDDNLNADATAKKAGMAVCGVFDDSSSEYEEEIKNISDYYIYNFTELLSL